MLHFCDGFDSYTATADLVKHKWHKYKTYSNNKPTIDPLDRIGAWQWSPNEGVKGGGCVKHTGSAVGDELGTQFIYYPQAYNGRLQYSTLFWFKIAAPPSTKQLLCEWWQVDNWGDYRKSMFIFVNPDGTLSFEVLEFKSFVGYFEKPFYETTFSACDNEWHCLEVRANLVTAAQEFKLGYDNFILTDMTFNINGQRRGAKCISFYSLDVGVWVDDVIVWDEAGDNPVLKPWGDMIDTRADEFIWDWYNNETVNSDLNNFPERGQDDFFYWMGPRQITTLRPASDGTINDFEVVGAGTKLDAVDDAMPDLGKYLVHDQAGARMVFNLEDFTYDLPVYSVVVNALTVMEDFGSIVAHAEALVSPDFETGVRRRISGNYVYEPTGTNLVPNGGPNFVDTTGWSTHDQSAVAVEDGKLRVTNTGSTTHTDPDPFVEIAVPVTPGRIYRISAQRSVHIDPPSTSNISIGGGTVAGDQYSSIDNFSVGTSSEEPVSNSEDWHVPPNVSTLYIQIYPVRNVPGDYYFDWITIEEMVPTWDFKYYQWAFRYNPATDLEWDQAGINAAEFGMRIAP